MTLTNQLTPSTPTPIAALFTRHAVGLWGTVLLARSLEEDLEARKPGSGRVLATVLPSPSPLELEEGSPPSLMDLCLRALTELGGDERPLRALSDGMRAGRRVDDALCLLELPEAAKAYVRSTLDAVVSAPHIKAARLLHGLEPVLAEALAPALVELETQARRTLFWTRRYLSRCAESSDQTETLHGLLQEICGDDIGLWTEALQAAEAALSDRLALLG
jgi:hypothetical protein